MPELPEVETCKRGITPHLLKAAIKAFTIRRPNLRWPIPVAALQALVGEKIQAVERRGKYIKIIVDSGYMLIHLGMSGSLRVLESPLPPAKHDHVDMLLDSGKILRFTDPRRFGCWLFQADKSLDHPLLQDIGPEPLTDDFNADAFYARSRHKTQSIKTFIMDSHVVVGVGNIYASESLFRSGISPKRKAGKLSRLQAEKLVQAIRDILQAAINQGGTTLRDFTNSEGKPGYFSQQLLVYGRENLPCFTCGTSIKNIKLGQRSTFYCQACQK